MDESKFVEEVIIRQFAAKTLAFCDLIENAKALPKRKFRMRLLELLAELYALAWQLPEEHDFAETTEVSHASQDEWQAIHQATGLSYYREVWDTSDLQCKDIIIRDLAEDIADIYRELRYGLDYYQRETENDVRHAVWCWRFDLAHWGYHAVSALKELHWTLYVNTKLPRLS